MARLILHVQFDNDLQDSVYDVNGDPLVPGGRTLAEGISEFLRSRGLNVSSVEQRDYYGWEFHWWDGWNLIVAVLQVASARGWEFAVGDSSGISLLFPRKSRESVRIAGLMIKNALESTGTGKNVRVDEEFTGRPRRGGQT
jgi:hypothetical protein